MKRTFGILIVAAVALAAVVSLLPLPAQAFLLFYDKNSNPPLPTNDFIDWPTAFQVTPPATIPNGSQTTSPNFGISVTVTEPDPLDPDFLNLIILQPQPDFIPGQASLWNFGNGPLKIEFGRPIFAAGGLIRPNANNKDYVGKIEAFNSAGVSLGFNEETFAKETAEFMGVFDTQESIKSLQFSVELINPETFNSNDFFLGRLDFLASKYGSCPPCPPVPLPGSLLLVGSVLLGAAGLRRLKS